MNDFTKPFFFIELEAFSSILSVFRAQGDLSSKKLKIIKHVSAALNITPDRYKAEIRKAINDPVLTAISSRYVINCN